MVAFADASEFWGSFVDALSGRTSAIVAPPVTFNNWTSPYFGAIVRAIPDTTVTVNVPGVGGVDCSFPSPTLDMAGWRSVAAHVGWRRCAVVSADAYFENGDPGFLKIARDALVAAVWPAGLEFFPITVYSLGFGCAVDSLSVTFNVVLTAVSALNLASYSAGPDASSLYLDNVIDVMVDLFPWIQLRHPYPWGSTPWVWPLDPDAQEPMASLMQYASETSLTIPGADVDALNNLADVLSGGQSTDGTLQTHRGRKILSVAGGSVVLPVATGSTENMMHRLATAVRAWLGSSINLRTRRPNANVAPTRGVIVRR